MNCIKSNHIHHRITNIFWSYCSRFRLIVRLFSCFSHQQYIQFCLYCKRRLNSFQSRHNSEQCTISDAYLSWNEKISVYNKVANFAGKPFPLSPLLIPPFPSSLLIYPIPSLFPSSFISSSFYPKFHSSSKIFSSLLLKGIFNASSLSNSSQTLYRKENKAYYWPCGPAAQTGVEHVRPPYPYPFGRRTDGSLKNP